MQDLRDLELLFDARVPLIAIESREERRVLGLFVRHAWAQGRTVKAVPESDG